MQNVEDIYPLTPMQQGMLYHSLAAPGSEVYFEQMCCSLRGRLVPAVLERAWQEVVNRHPALRTAFLWEGLDEPLQVVRQQVTLPWTEEDWRGGDASARGARLERFLEEDRKRGFDFSSAPLMRIALLRFDDDAWCFVWSHHHLLLDGWSLPRLLKEVFTCYALLETGQPLPPSRVRPFREYIGWLQAQPSQGGEAWWRRALEGFTTPTALPVDRALSERIDGEPVFEEQRLTLSPEETRRLQQFARQHQLTLNTLVQGAWALLLGRYSGEDDVLFGVTVSGRPPQLPGVESMIGLFINTLPLRVALPPSRGLLEWLRGLQEQQAELRQYEHTPLVRIHGWSDVPREQPLFSSIVVFENYVVDAAAMRFTSNLKVEEMRFFERTNYPLTVVAAPGEELLLRLIHDVKRFDRPTAAQLLEHFRRLLARMPEMPERALVDLPLLTAEEQHQVLRGWNDTRVSFPWNGLAHELFEAQAERTPDAVAVTFPASGSGGKSDEQLTYRELNLRANRLAHRLRAMGVGPDVCVGICVERSIEMTIGVLGILKAGGCYVPLDPHYPRDRLALMAADARLGILLSQRHLLAELPAHGARVLCLEGGEVYTPEGEAPDTRNPASGVHAENLVFILYTSGSTGRPKGVAMRHGSLLNMVLWQLQASALGQGARTLQFSSLSFDVSFQEMFCCWASGGTLVLVSEELRRDPLELLRYLAEQGIHRLCLPFVALQQLAEAAGASPELLLPLREVLTSGEQLQVTDAVARLFGRLENAVLSNEYGPIESHVTTCHTLSGAPSAWSRLPPIGRPIANIRVYVIDRYGRPVPPGVPGELFISGASIARGYLFRPELTAERFLPDPFSPEPGARMYATGDLACHRPDGTLLFLGRKDHQVKVRGFRIEPGEIEATLSHHPGVAEAVVIAREDTPRRKRLVAYVVQAAGVRPAARELREFLAARLPDFMVPDAFVFLDALPLTSSGKVHRRALPAPGTERPELVTDYAAPRTPEEGRLCELWAAILGLERVGIHDNFFELGGHSLLAAQLVFRVRETFRVNLPLRAIVAAPTVAALAERLWALQGSHSGDAPSGAERPSSEPASWNAIVPAPQQRHEPFPLAPTQQAYWLGRQNLFAFGNVASHVYLELDCPAFPPERIRGALERLITRHEMLRAVIQPDGRQRILPGVPPYPLEVLDLRAASEAEVAVRLGELRERMSHQVLPSERWPLFELKVSWLAATRMRLHLSLDALIADASSLQLIAREFLEAVRSPEAPQEKLELSFRDYVLAEETLRDTESFRRSRDYWLQRLPGLPPAPELPLAPGLSSQPASAPRFVRRESRLEATHWRAFKERAARAGLTPSMALLSAFAEVLAAWSSNPWFTLNVTSFRRLPLHPQVERIVGDFTSLTLLEVDYRRPRSFEERARQVQEQLFRDLDHADFSGIDVIRELSRQRGRYAQALMPVVFTSALPLGAGGQGAFSLPEIGELTYAVTQTPQVWIDHQVFEAGGALVLSWDVVEGLFPQGLIDDMFSAYVALLDRLSTQAAAWQTTDSRLVPAAQLAQRAAVNATTAPLSGALLHTLFEAQEAREGERVAVIAPELTLTYRELGRRARQLGHHLRALGVRPNQLVAIVMEKGWGQVVAALGILYAGAAYLPIDPGLPTERRFHLLARGEAAVAITDARSSVGLEWPEGVTRLSVEDSREELPGDPPLPPVQAAGDLAYVLFTSGSTGLPKGVMISHQAAVNTILDVNERFGVTASDRVLALSALSFDLSVYDVFGLLAVGGAIVFPAPGEQRDPAHWASLLARHRVTIWNTVPALMRALADHARDKALRFEALRLVLLSGDWIPLALPSGIRALAPGVRIISLGGATEAAIWSILHPIEDIEPWWKSIPYGRPMVNQHLHVLNTALAPCPVWVTGAIYIGGAGIALGYWRDSERTAASFITHPETGERLYRTGDLGRYLPNGEIELLGREDFQVKIQGYRIELGEIEAACSQHPDVKSVVVTAKRASDGAGRLMAYVVPVGQTAPVPSELRRFLLSKLPEYMVPSTFVFLPSLPLSATGKIDRNALPEPRAVEAGPAPADTPISPTEAQLMALVGEALKLSSLSPQSNLFELGANSIDLIRLAGRLEETRGFRPRLELLFQSPTIATLAAALDEHLGRASAAEGDASQWEVL
nr:nonribosomal peptide synthetase [Cystobacter sp.]